MRLLLVEDDAPLRDSLAGALRAEGWVVDPCGDGEEALWLGTEEPYDAAVLDLGLPRRDGISVLQGWREAGRRFPVLLLTARQRWNDKLAGFGAGADDYLTKPFDTDELVLRLKALIRRASGHATPVIGIGPLELDTLACRFRLDGRPLALTAGEYRLLAYLAHHAGRTVPRAELAEHLYERDFDLDSNVIDVQIGRIRRKLAPHRLLHTERGLGFRLGLE
ncbi:response regulator transcription factor [Silanimonas lenta]|uniref:response regulator transcription factor n=1 Tax=Silanimonas lenta TaxID=265429 RepID=UPI00041A4447|nr:response regulator transcription factor [Silanimonas lenta]